MDPDAVRRVDDNSGGVHRHAARQCSVGKVLRPIRSKTLLGDVRFVDGIFRNAVRLFATFCVDTGAARTGGLCDWRGAADSHFVDRVPTVGVPCQVSDLHSGLLGSWGLLRDGVGVAGNAEPWLALPSGLLHVAAVRLLSCLRCKCTLQAAEENTSCCFLQHLILKLSSNHCRTFARSIAEVIGQ